MKKLIDYVEEYITEKYNTAQVCSNTYRTDQVTLSSLKKLIPLQKEPKDVNVEDINAILSNPDISLSTKKKYKTLIKNGLLYAQDAGAISENIMVTKAHKIYKLKEKARHVGIVSLTVEEQRKLVKVLEQETDRNTYKWIWLFELNTGMRAGEVLALQKKDVDLKNKTISVSKTISRDVNGKEYSKSHPKTSAGYRLISLNDTTYPICQKALKYSYPHSDLLFFSPSNKDPQKNELTVGYSNNRLKNFILKNEICPPDRKISQHLLRHTFATRCIESGVPAEVIKVTMGHASIRETIDTYADIFNNYAQRYGDTICDYYKDQNILYGFNVNPKSLALSDLGTVERIIKTSRIEKQYKARLLYEVGAIQQCYGIEDMVENWYYKG